MTNMSDLGGKVARRRDEMDLTQEELAELVDISRGYMGHIESGSRQKIGSDKLYNLCMVLGLSADYLLFTDAERARLVTPPITPAAPLTKDGTIAYDATSRRVPIYMERTQKKNPLAVEDHLEGHIDLHDMLAPRNEPTIVVRVSERGMSSAGVNAGDLVIAALDREPINGDIVVVRLDGGITIRRFISDGTIRLVLSHDGELEPIVLDEERKNVEIVGVVKYTIHVTG